MVKFASKEDSGYRTVSGHMRIMVRNANEAVSKRWETEAREIAGRQPDTQE